MRAARRAPIVVAFFALVSGLSGFLHPAFGWLAITAAVIAVALLIRQYWSIQSQPAGSEPWDLLERLSPTLGIALATLATAINAAEHTAVLGLGFSTALVLIREPFKQLAERPLRARAEQLHSRREQSPWPYVEPPVAMVRRRHHRLFLTVNIVIALSAIAAIFIEGVDLPARLFAIAAVLLVAPQLSMLTASSLSTWAAMIATGERGISLANIDGLRIAADVATVAIKARGVLTDGSLRVASLRSADGSDASEHLPVIAGAEAVAPTHPVARAIRDHAHSEGLTIDPVSRATHRPGQGIVGIAPDGQLLVLGSRELLLEHGFAVATADAEAARVEAAGRTAVFFGLGERVEAVVGVEDTVRPGARGAIQKLFDLGLEVVLLSGGARKPAEVLGDALELSNLRVSLSGDEQREELRRLRDGTGPVALVAPHDAEPALLDAADLPVRLGSTGENLDEQGWAVTSDDLRDAAAAFRIARSSHRAAQRALGGAALIGGAFAVLAAWGTLGLMGAAIAGLALDILLMPAGFWLLQRFDRAAPIPT